MNSTPGWRGVVWLALLATGSASAASLVLDRAELIFSGVVATTTEVQSVTVLNADEAALAGASLRITGEQAAAFKLVGAGALVLKPNEARSIGFVFCPAAGQIGPLSAVGEVVSADGRVLGTVALRGLAAIGVEGVREPWMSHILQTLGFAVDVGWSEHHTHTRPELVGEEIRAQRFRRAAPGVVQMMPVARYSPDFLLPFGYYLPGDTRPTLRTVGALALKTPTRPEHNCLYPSLASGTTSFDPGATDVFGVFTSSPSHIAYSEDAQNTKWESKHVAHAVRVYPAKDRAGQPLANSYLVCFEEASNGDYQDYVFLLTNVVAVE